MIRDFRADRRGIRVWGARTMSSDPLWRYVNVRRLFNYVKESVDEGTQWVVFEPNDENTWARVRQVVTDFLTLVWRSGALFGATEEQAFFVRCGPDTMTPADIDAGPPHRRGRHRAGEARGVRDLPLPAEDRRAGHDLISNIDQTGELSCRLPFVKIPTVVTTSWSSSTASPTTATAVKAGCSEVSGLETEVTPVEYRNGNEDITVRKIPGLKKFMNITLKRGMTGDMAMWNWIRNAMKGQVLRAQGSIIMHDENHQPVWRWNFTRGWPCKYTGPGYNAANNETGIRDRRDLPRRSLGRRPELGAMTARSRNHPASGCSSRAPAEDSNTLRTDIAAFAGPTERGPLGELVRIAGWREYLSRFGELTEGTTTAFALRGYFENEGEIAYVVRTVAAPGHGLDRVDRRRARSGDAGVAAERTRQRRLHGGALSHRGQQSGRVGQWPRSA